jgi:HK97 gp10 family phage protein
MSIEITDKEKVIKMLDSVIDEEKLLKGLQRAVLYVERSAKIRAPKGDGDLKRSIQSKVEDNVGYVYTNLEYAPYVEYGTGLFAEEGGRTEVPWSYKDEKGEWHTTKGMKPHPFMRPALNENRTTLTRLIKEALRSD